MVHNFTENRESLEVYKDGELKANNTVQEDPSRYMLGQNVVYNYPISELHLIINGKGKISPMSEAIIEMEAIEACGVECLEIGTVVPKEDFFRYWSDPSNWADNQIPGEGSDVEILQ